MIFNRGKGWKSETPQNLKSADKGKLLFMFFELGFPGERLAAYVARKYCTSVVGLFVPLS